MVSCDALVPANERSRNGLRVVIEEPSCNSFATSRTCFSYGTPLLSYAQMPKQTQDLTMRGLIVSSFCFHCVLWRNSCILTASLVHPYCVLLAYSLHPSCVFLRPHCVFIASSRPHCAFMASSLRPVVPSLRCYCVIVASSCYSIASSLHRRCPIGPSLRPRGVLIAF